MTREMIINALENKGYRAEAQNTIKNGVELEGIRILTNSNVAPVIYTEEIIERAEREYKTLDDVVSAIIGIYESHKSFEFDVEALFDRNFVLSHLYIGLQKDSTENIIKRPCEFEGIESYLYIRGEVDNADSYSIKLSEQILERAEISEVEAWEVAEQNTNAETSLESMAKVMADIMGMDFTEELEGMTPIYVISNKSKVKGASAVLNKEVLAEFGKKYNTNKIVVLPSSVHEMLLVPYTEETDLESFSSMVEEVNDTQVDPTERLTNRAYIITL